MLDIWKYFDLIFVIPFLFAGLIKKAILDHIQYSICLHASLNGEIVVNLLLEMKVERVVLENKKQKSKKD